MSVGNHACLSLIYCLFSGSNRFDWRRQKQPDFRQHFLKALPGAARAGVVSPEFFQQFFVAVNYPVSASYLRLGWIAVSTLADDLESMAVRCFLFS
jgi:hypothetical protein